VLRFGCARFTRPSKKTIGEYSRQFTGRLQHSGFPAFEKHFGCTPPACVRLLYADREELLQGDFETAAVPDASPDHRWDCLLSACRRPVSEGMKTLKNPKKQVCEAAVNA
jgi:hypothetical protein